MFTNISGDLSYIFSCICENHSPINQKHHFLSNLPSFVYTISLLNCSNVLCNNTYVCVCLCVCVLYVCKFIYRTRERELYLEREGGRFACSNVYCVSVDPRASISLEAWEGVRHSHFPPEICHWKPCELRAQRIDAQ